MNDAKQTGSTPEANALETAARLPLVGSRVVEAVTEPTDTPVVEERGEQTHESLLALPEGVQVKQPPWKEVEWEVLDSQLADGTQWVVPKGRNDPESRAWLPIAMTLRPGVAQWIVDEHNRNMISSDDK